MVDQSKELSSKDFPEKSLGYRFPSFEDFRKELSDKGGKNTSGDTSKYQPLSKELTQKTDQYGSVSTFDQKSDTNITTHKGVNYAPLDAHDILKEYFDTGNWAKYLEALKMYHEQNEEEYGKLPDTSNRKPRVAIRTKYGENLLKAYQKELKRQGEFKLITKEEFLARIRGEREGFTKVVGGEKPEQLMIGLLGDPGLGKTYICQAIGKALGTGYYRISLNGKNSSSIIYGSSIENPGAEMGGIVKAISENKSQFAVFFIDEIEKAGKEAKDAIGEPTDRTGNSEFKDALYDFITPCNNLLFFCALNYAEELPDFIRDRFTMIEIKPPSYKQRIEILRAILMKALLKKALTKTMSIRGAKSNIARFRPKEEDDIGDKRRGRPACPFGEERAEKKSSNLEHRKGCKCFLGNLKRVPG
ncbi:2992_t:CDS:2 [Ambispora gerdemannii]|uniref:2992_t:CDS:1 n=1 Tax=Ambispora gerdemannii TaxID=144530 RepID=A0A9N8W5H4_9GLOM|nr:2992_t:CDS:2 [Ambispora gerdemannii]